MKRLFTAWTLRPWLTSAFLLACAVTLFFAGRLVFFTIYWTTHQEMPVQGWMTVGYVARSWGLEPLELDAEAGLPLPEEKRRAQPLSEIARDRGVPVAEVIAEVEAAVAALRAREGSSE
jgi:hypothetical protein